MQKIYHLFVCLFNAMVYDRNLTILRLAPREMAPTESPCRLRGHHCEHCGCSVGSPGLRGWGRRLFWDILRSWGLQLLKAMRFFRGFCGVFWFGEDFFWWLFRFCGLSRLKLPHAVRIDPQIPFISVRPRILLCLQSHWSLLVKHF